MSHTVGCVATQVSLGVTSAGATWAVTHTLHLAGHQGEQVAVQDGVDGLQGHEGHLHCPNQVTGVRLEPE